MKNKTLEILKDFKSIFCNSFLWNIGFPFLIGLMVNYTLSDARQLIIYLIWIPIFSIPYFIFSKRFLLFLPWFVTLMFGLLDIFHWVSIKAPVSKYSLFVLFETTIHEAKGFINLKWSYLYLLIPIYLFLSFYLFYKDLKKKYLANKTPIILLLLVSIVFLGENLYHNRFIRKATPTVFSVMKSFNAEIKEYIRIAGNMESYLGEINAKSLALDNEQVTVIVIGESTTRNKMSLYGYGKETNPLLKKREDIAVFTDVISPFTHTQAAVRTCLTYSNIENKIEYTKAQSIIDIARASDYETYWISNQAAIGVWDNLVALLAKTSQNISFVNDIVNSRALIETANYDENVFSPFAKILKEKNNKKFIIIHLLGTHTTYAKRYPEAFNVFKTEGDYYEKIKVHYNNAVLYNDFVVNSIIDTLAKYSKLNNSISNLVYFSDHGENVYDDERKLIGHDWWGLPTNHLLEIPFIAWTSPNYKKQFPKTDSLIYSNTHKSFCTDNLFHSAIELMQIKSDLFIDSLSIFNEIYTEKERFIVKGLSYENEVLKGKLQDNKE